MQEDRHVWKEYLSRAVAAGDDALFESALAFSKEPVRGYLCCGLGTRPGLRLRLH